MRISDWSSVVCSSDLMRRHFKFCHASLRGQTIFCSIRLSAVSFSDWIMGSGRQSSSRRAFAVSNRLAGPKRVTTRRKGGLTERKRVGKGKRVYVRVELGGRRHIQKKMQHLNRI